MEKIFSLEEVKDIAEKLLSQIKGNKKGRASLLSLSGDLGAGKTTITKEIAKYLGVKENIISPTFVIMKKYKTKDAKLKTLIHIDAYRLDNPEDILVLGWEDMLSDPSVLVVLEWPEKIEKYLPKDIYNVTLEHQNDTTRSIKFWYN